MLIFDVSPDKTGLIENHPNYETKAATCEMIDVEIKK